MSDDDSSSYAALLARSGARRRVLFSKLQQSGALGGAYLGRWGRSMMACR